MKLIIAITLLSTTTLAFTHPPTLIARFGTPDAWNAPGSMSCFFSEPLVTETTIYLGCMDEQGGGGLVQWNPEFSVTAVARADHHFSTPRNFRGTVTWSEFDEWGSRRFFQKTNERLHVTPVPDLGGATPTDNLFLINQSLWIYRFKLTENHLLKLWDGSSVVELGLSSFTHIFPPAVGEHGEVVFKTREGGTEESRPDKLWCLEGGLLKLIFEDRDSNPASPWLSFRHQMSVDGRKVLLVASDEAGEALVLIDGPSVEVIARAGTEIGSFDFFTPKLRNRMIAFRGEDFSGRKTLWKHEGGVLKVLMRAGDVVESDLGPARVDYTSKHSIMYGSPGIGPYGEVVQQATLTKLEDPTHVLGIGLLKFSP